MCCCFLCTNLFIVDPFIAAGLNEIDSTGGERRVSLILEAERLREGGREEEGGDEDEGGGREQLIEFVFSLLFLDTNEKKGGG